MRYHVNDFLQNFRFHLLDVSFSTSGIPFVFNPIAGFSSISSPELTLNTEEIEEGNSKFVHHVRRKVSCSSVVLSKGVEIIDTSFWDWFVATANRLASGGNFSVSGRRRDLVLVQFTNYGIGTQAEGFSDFLSNISVLGGGFIPDFRGSLKVPGKAWLLKDCFPTRYKPTSDLDATSGDISLEEIEIQPRYFEQLSLTG